MHRVRENFLACFEQAEKKASNYIGLSCAHPAGVTLNIY